MKKVSLDREWVLSRLMRNARVCMGEEPEPGKESTRYDPTAANKALELLGKTDELSLFVERRETANTNYVIGATPVEQDDDTEEPTMENWLARHKPN